MQLVKPLLSSIVACVAAGSYLPAAAQPCLETHPIVCTTASEQFFIGLMFGQPLQFINFETLPNGQPSISGTQITPSFNYTHLGVTFSAPVGTPIIGGSGPGDHDLRVLAFSPPAHTWLRADFSHPSLGAGIWFNGATALTAFDANDSVIASMSYGFSGGPWFVGIYSEIPIAYVTADRGSNVSVISDFIFNPIPEPASALLLLAALPLRRRPRPTR
jgi:hypothetical protein